MKSVYFVVLLVPALGLCSFAANADDVDRAYWSNVENSFTAMLNHEPNHGPVAATVARGERDAVETFVHAMIRGEWAQAPTRIAGVRFPPETGFDRLFAHEPYAGETVVTVSLDQKDPMEKAVYAALFPQGVHTIIASSER